jgi:hypothetical protein
MSRPQSTFFNVRDGEGINSDADTLENTGPDRIPDAYDYHLRKLALTASLTLMTIT